MAFSFDSVFLAANDEITRRASGHFVTHTFIYHTSARITLTAVGAVNMFVTLCCSITRKNAPASGVPTGLPCKKKEQQVSLHHEVLN